MNLRNAIFISLVMLGFSLSASESIDPMAIVVVAATRARVQPEYDRMMQYLAALYGVACDEETVWREVALRTGVPYSKGQALMHSMVLSQALQSLPASTASERSSWLSSPGMRLLWGVVFMIILYFGRSLLAALLKWLKLLSWPRGASQSAAMVQTPVKKKESVEKGWKTYLGGMYGGRPDASSSPDGFALYEPEPFTPPNDGPDGESLVSAVRDRAGDAVNWLLRHQQQISGIAHIAGDIGRAVTGVTVAGLTLCAAAAAVPTNTQAAPPAAPAPCECTQRRSLQMPPFAGDAEIRRLIATRMQPQAGEGGQQPHPTGIVFAPSIGETNDRPRGEVSSDSLRNELVAAVRQVGFFVVLSSVASAMIHQAGRALFDRGADGFSAPHGYGGRTTPPEK